VFGLLALLLVVPTPHFRALPGWHVGSAGPAHACAYVGRNRCTQAAGWASTVRYRDCPNCVPPHRTLSHLPPSGIVIQLTQARERPDRAQVGRWPLRVRADRISAGFEGVPNRYGVFQAFSRTGHLERSLFVWFGRAHPTRRQLARANAELRTAR
jgi:hypothetical protein